MIRTIVVLALVVAAVSAFGEWEPHLSKTFLKFDEVPSSLSEAVAKGYVQVDGPTSSVYNSTLWVNLKDLMTGVLFDENGLIVGIQISLDEDKLTSYYDMTEQGFQPWTYTTGGVTKKYWIIRYYFVTNDETRKNYAGGKELLVEKYLTVEGNNGEIVKIPTDLANLSSIWTKQACMPMMGTHYYYNMTTSLSCVNPLFPWFPLFDKQQLIGVGLMVMGKMKDSSSLEDPGTTAVKMIVPTAPECLYDLVTEVGVFTMHSYFVKNPLLINCFF